MACEVRPHIKRTMSAHSCLIACTAVVTEIGYHTKSTIDADISFLSLAEWKSELTLLLYDMVDETGNLKRSADLKSDAGIAWSKVRGFTKSESWKWLSTVDECRLSLYHSRRSRPYVCRSDHCV